MWNVKKESTYGALDYAINETGGVPVTTVPHFTCRICGDGTYHEGGFVVADRHHGVRHPDAHPNFHIVMRYPEGAKR